MAASATSWVLPAAVLLSYLWLLNLKVSGERIFRPAEPRAPRWNELDVAAVLAAFLLLGGVFSVLAAECGLESLLPVDSSLKLLMICIMLRVIRLRGQNPGEALGLGLRGLGSSLASGLAVFLALLPVFLGVAYLWQEALVRLCGEHCRLTQDLVEALRTAPSPARTAQIAIAALLVAPVVEELFFRGLLYGALRRRVRPWVAASAVGILFGVSHSPVAVVVPLALLGALLCYVYEKTARLTVPIAIHMLFNLYGVVQAWPT